MMLVKALITAVFLAMSGSAFAQSLENSEFAADISPSTGLVTRLVSKQPLPVEVTAGDYGLRVYVKDPASGKIWNLDRAEAIGGQMPGLISALSFRIKGESDCPAEVEMRYVLNSDGLAVAAKFIYTQNRQQPCVIGVYQSLNTGEWPKQTYNYGGPFSSADRNIQQYSFDHRMLDDPKWGMLCYPMGCLMRDDRTLLFGDLELSDYAVIATNVFPNSVISFLTQPKEMAKGDSYTFNYVLKSFAAPRQTYSDALAWYVRHMSFSDPDFKTPVQVPESRVTTIPPGCIVPYQLSHSPLSNIEPTAKAEELEQKMLERGFTNLWYANWDSWQETAPTSGDSWYNREGIKITRQSFRQEVARLQKKGFRVFIYFRQGVWFTKEDFDSPNEMPAPPYKRWMNKKDGKIKLIVCENTYSALKKNANLGDKLCWAELDFCNPEARAWYIDRVKKAVEVSGADGVAWDMGWNYMVAFYNDKSPSAFDPDSNIYEGELKVQAEIYRWIKQEYKDKYVLQNFGLGAPPSLFADAVILEGGAGSIADPMMQAGCAYGVVRSSYADPYYARQAGKIEGKALGDIIRHRPLMALAQGCPFGGNLPWGLIDHSEECTKYYSGCFTRLEDVDVLGEIGRISAKVSAIPLVFDRFAITSSPEKVFASAWVNKDTLVIAAYNDSDEEREVTVTLSASALKSAGFSARISQPKFTIFRKDATVRPASFSAANSGDFSITGKLGSRELVVVEGNAGK